MWGGATKNIKPNKLFFQWSSSAITQSYTFEKDCYAMVIAVQNGGSSNPGRSYKINGVSYGQTFYRNGSLVTSWGYFFYHFKKGDELTVTINKANGDYPRMCVGCFELNEGANVQYVTAGETYTMENFTKNYALVMLSATRGTTNSTHTIDLKKNNTTVAVDEKFQVSSSTDIFGIYYLDCSDVTSISFTADTEGSYSGSFAIFIQ